jgi:polyhydroxyalkanoate synthesis regulator phasin
MKTTQILAKKYLTTASNVNETMAKFKEFSAQEAEDFFLALGKYYKESQDELDNMDAVKISNLLLKVSDLIKNRTGN